MILETLRALVAAGRDALQTTCGLPVNCEHIQQVRQGTLTFPALGELSLYGATIQHVHLGCDALLAAQLSELISNEGRESGISILANRFLEGLLAEVGGRHSSGEVVSLDVGPRSVHTRGLRTFGFRLETVLGQLFILAEIPSRIEMEEACGSGFVSNLVDSYLPSDWLTIDGFDQGKQLDNFFVFMRKGEADVHLEIPRPDGASAVHTGFLVEQVRENGERLLKMTVDLVESEAPTLQMGQKIAAKVGVKDHSIEFSCEFRGFSKSAVQGGTELNCMLFSLPHEVRIEQRRRAFRISMPTRVMAEIEWVDPETNSSLAIAGQSPPPSIRGRLADLSFSGARIIGNLGELCSNLGPENRVLCRIFFPQETMPLEVTGIIKRSRSAMAHQDNWHDDIGLEFLVAPGMDRTALDYIRQYVLSEQRSLLARRIQVAGMDQW